MLDAGRFLEDMDENDRKREKNLGILLMLPSFFLIILPLFYFVSMSVYHGRDEFEPLRYVLNHYHVALLLPMIICLACLCASVHLIIIKDFTARSEYRHY